MEEAEVNGQKVLTPVLYLAQANNRLAPNVALIQGQDVRPQKPKVISMSLAVS